jgi:hypothetical protein
VTIYDKNVSEIAIAIHLLACQEGEEIWRALAASDQNWQAMTGVGK